MLLWENGGKIDLLKVNYPLREPELLFRKIEDSEITAQVEKLHANGTRPASLTSSSENAVEKKDGNVHTTRSKV